MTRRLLVLNTILVAAVGVLWRLDRDLQSRRESARAAASAFHLIADGATPPVPAIGRIELRLPGSDAVWVVEKKKGGWRLPGFHDAYAVQDAVDGFLKSLLEGRGTLAGGVARDGARFGLARDRVLDARLFNAAGALALHAVAGDVAPGKGADECFVAVAGDDRVLQLATNPWSMARIDPTSPLPPFTDARIIPGALQRPMPARISLSGPEAPPIGPFWRRDTPIEEMQRTMGKAPRYQWFATTPEGERRLNDVAAAAYLNNFLTLSFDELLGGVEGRESAFEKPALVVTIGYEGGAADVLTLGTKTAQGRRHLLNGSTRQAFLVSPAKAATLHPDVRALLEQPASGQASR